MKKMSDSAQVRMNAAISSATTTPMDTFRRFDLTQAATYSIEAGIKAIDNFGLWTVRVEDAPTDDMQKRALLVAEMKRRGGSR